MSIKQQLRKYYNAQGLTGEHLRKALSFDLRQVRKGPVLNIGSQQLSSRLNWDGTPQGYAYWLERACGTGK